MHGFINPLFKLSKIVIFRGDYNISDKRVVSKSKIIDFYRNPIIEPMNEQIELGLIDRKQKSFMVL